MKRSVFVLLIALLPLVGVGRADASIPVGHRGIVSADVSVIEVGETCPFCGASVLGPAHLQVYALDVDPTPVVCLGCQTADIGWLRYERPGFSTGWLRISSVELFTGAGPRGEDLAIVSAGIFFVNLVDGGVPGNTVTGPPDAATGIAPTLDYYYGCCAFLQAERLGLVQAGEIHISSGVQRPRSRLVLAGP